jgi:hypothetical protein
MQARKLKALLNNTGYTVAYYKSYIGIGSSLCHDLLKVTIPEFKIKYALDSYSKQGRMAVGHHEELYFIWGKLQELIDSGELKAIVEGNDVIEKPLPVYTVMDGTLFCTTTDTYGWPNTTAEGYMMYDNTFFETFDEAVEYGIKEYEARVANINERIREEEKEIERIKAHGREYEKILAEFKSLNPAKGAVTNTMNNQFDPGTQQEEVKGQEATNDAVQATEQEAQEQAMESAEEGTTEG